MKQVISSLLAALVFGGACVTAGSGQESISGLDLHEAADLLAGVEFAFPAEGAKLWDASDGLPAPEDRHFAQQASQFLAGHPIPSPDETSVVWDVPNVASRQCKCLAYLAGGKKEAQREVAGLAITQAMRLQRILPPRTGGGRGVRDTTFYAASGSLCMTGSLLRRQAEGNSALYEVGTQWTRTGLGQLATYGEKGGEALRKAAKAMVGDAIADRKIRDSHGTDEEFFSQLDLTRLDMRSVAEHVAARDLEQAKLAYVDVLAKRFSSKLDRPKVQVVTGAIDQEAEDICRNIFLLTIHMHKRVDFGEKVDWSRVIDNDIESRVWLNGHHALMRLLSAYQRTGNEKYVKHLCRLFNSWYETSPPTFQRSHAQWRTHEVAIRPDRRWPVILAALADHPTFKRECLFNMARSMLDHGKYLSMYTMSGGNWLQAESTGLACVALLFPEFKLSPLFYTTASDRLTRVNTGYFLPDGFQSECSPGYHGHALFGISNMLSLAKRFEAPVPGRVMEQYENAVEAGMYIAYPDLTLAMLSDQGPNRNNVGTHLQEARRISDREDFRWFISGGKKGAPPTHVSCDFTHAGYCVMRDKWGHDGQVLIFDAGYFGSGHQHEDKLNFVYYAGGRELIGDPGIYAYKRDEFEPYWRGSWGHNTVVIDGLSQHRKLGPVEEIPDPDRRFVIGDDFDFAVGWYKHAYSPRGSRVWEGKPRNSKADAAAVVRNLQHQRCVFYVKGRYAIICDRVLGKGEHQVDILFHPAPIVSGTGTQRVVRAVDLEIKPNGTAVTKESKHANVAIIPAQGESFEVLDLIGQKDPVRGWYALYGIQPSHDIVYRCRAELPRHFETVVQPLPSGNAEPMDVRALEVTSKNGKTCAGVSCGDDLLLVSYDGPAEMTCGNIRYHGTALLMRRDANGKPTRANMVDGGLLRIDDKEVFSTEAPTPARSVVLSKGE